MRVDPADGPPGALDGKVQLSISSARSPPPFSLDLRESGGRVELDLRLQNDPLNHVSHPTFLELTMDGSLTFREHIWSLKKTMSRGRSCLAAHPGRGCGCHWCTLREAHICYIRSLAACVSAVYMTHATPASRQTLESEQNACA